MKIKFRKTNLNQNRPNNKGCIVDSHYTEEKKEECQAVTSQSVYLIKVGRVVAHKFSLNSAHVGSDYAKYIIHTIRKYPV